MTDPFNDAEHQAIVDDLIGRNQQILHNEDIVVNTSVGTRVMIGSTMIYGDTGWRDVTSLMINGWTAVHFQIKRINNQIHARAYNLDGRNATASQFMTMPSGFNNGGSGWMTRLGDEVIVVGGNQIMGIQGSYSRLIFTGGHWFGALLHTSSSWPESLPGTPGMSG